MSDIDPSVMEIKDASKENERGWRVAISHIREDYWGKAIL